MAVAAQQKWIYARQIEKEINTELEKKNNFPLVEHFDNLVQELRNSCQDTIFLDFQYATEKGVENRLWAVHTMIKDRHKKLISSASTKEPKNLVAIRKLQKRYADFIKTSQYFYKGYIQRLASKYAGMKGLRRIAHRLSLDTLSADDVVKVAPELERLIDASCHATLLRLGDLSRYRNEIRTKDRSWEPALAYYSLAGNLCPDSGSSHNQMAVIALAEQNHLEALYHLYRAIAIEEPYPMAKGNLEIEFKKITAAWEKKPALLSKLSSEETLVLWFVRLHAKFYKGSSFPSRDELENEVISRLARLLKEQSFEITLEKLVIVTIAAHYCAAERSQDDNATSDTRNSPDLLLRFNIRMISVLLQMLQPELEDPASGEELPSNSDASQSTKPRERITAIARRILPALRQYSSWLVSRSSDIANTAASKDLGPRIKQMWAMYADVMTKIAGVFPVEDLATVGYLLEEDETTIGFKPLRNSNLSAESNLYVDENGMLKPRLTDPGIERNHPNVEMVARIRDILLCALTLYAGNMAPITLDAGKFVFLEGQPIQAFEGATPSASTHISHPSYPGKAVVPASINQEHSGSTGIVSVAAPDSHHSMDTDLLRMVESLVESSSGRGSTSNETSYGMHSLTANDVFAPMGSNGVQAPPHGTPNMYPSLPGIWKSPFTPQPHELQATSPDRPTTARRLSPLQLSTSEQQLAAAATLDEVTGYGRPESGSWGRRISGPSSNLQSQSVHQVLQESLSQQYMPMTMGSPAFADSSSIYGNTPRDDFRYRGGGLAGGSNAVFNGNNTTTYAGASDWDRTTMLQSSIWNGSQPAQTGYAQTPPGGQGG